MSRISGSSLEFFAGRSRCSNSGFPVDRNHKGSEDDHGGERSATIVLFWNNRCLLAGLQAEHDLEVAEHEYGKRIKSEAQPLTAARV